MPAQVMTASEAFCDVPEHSSASYTEYDAPENRHCNNADWADATPEATPYSWYEFFIPSRVQEMVERRRKQFETLKLFFVLMSDPENVKVRKDVVQKLLSDVEVLMIPALQEERHGAESINELRQEIFDAMHNLTIHMVDIVPEDGEEGSIISIRTICKATQVKPIFPHLPVGVPVQIGLKISVALNSAWRPRASCWNFIPVEPLLEICNMQDMVKLMDTTTTTRKTTTTTMCECGAKCYDDDGNWIGFYQPDCDCKDIEPDCDTTTTRPCECGAQCYDDFGNWMGWYQPDCECQDIQPDCETTTQPCECGEPCSYDSTAAGGVVTGWWQPDCECKDVQPDCETTTTKQSDDPVFQEAQRQCTDPLCTIDTLAKCEMAAQQLGWSDTTANPISSTTVVAGCSTNNGGGLRFNDVLTSAAAHPTGGQKRVFCMEC